MGTYEYDPKNKPKLTKSEQEFVEVYNEMRPMAKMIYEGTDASKWTVSRVFVPARSITHETTWTLGPAFKAGSHYNTPNDGVIRNLKFDGTVPEEGPETIEVGECCIYAESDTGEQKKFTAAEFAHLIGWKKGDGIAPAFKKDIPEQEIPDWQKAQLAAEAKRIEGEKAARALGKDKKK